MQRPTRVVLAIDAPDVSDEIVHALDRSGDAHVVGTAADGRQLVEAVRQLEPDLVLAEPRLAVDVPVGTACVIVASRESVAALRAALAAGAAGFFVWPLERDALLERVRQAGIRRAPLERRATVVAVHASRGGAGCTFLATHLARALVTAGRSCALLDLDPDGDDVAVALGVGEDAESVHSLADVAAVAGELDPDAVRGAMWLHPDGFHAVVAPRSDVGELAAADVVTVVDVAAAAVDAVVVHTGRGLHDRTRTALTDADVVLEVLTLDIAAFRGASRTMTRLEVPGGDARWWLVVNKAARAELVPGDVARVFGKPAAAVIAADGAVPKAQDRGQLVSPRSRASRAIQRLAAEIVAPASLEGAA